MNNHAADPPEATHEEIGTPNDNFPVHPLAAIIPPMQDAQFAALVASISDIGLLDPIVVDCEHRIIDGRSRLRACREVRACPRYVRWNGQGSILEFILGKNLARRHPTSGQLAVIAVECEPFFAAEAQERQVHGTQFFGEGRRDRHEREAAAMAARATGSNRTYVGYAKVLRNTAPDLFEKVRAGYSLQAALRLARSRSQLGAPRQAVEEPNATTGTASLPNPPVLRGNPSVLQKRIQGAADLVFCQLNGPALQHLEELGELAFEKLKSGAYCVALMDQQSVPEVMGALTRCGLGFQWIIGVRRAGETAMRQPFLSWFRVGLVFVKGEPGSEPPCIPDFYGADKAIGGIEAEVFEDIIAAFTPDGAFVIDPVCGEGAILEAAWRCGRLCLGANTSAAACRRIEQCLGALARELTPPLRPLIEAAQPAD